MIGDQEKYLDEGLKALKAQAFHINSTIEKNQLRQCLKETNIFLAELKTSLLSPRNYYHLFTVAFDEMQTVESFFKEEIRRGRRIKDVYDAVQQASSIIPRMYLLITAGAIHIETQPKTAKEIIFDLLSMIKGVQNPIRGLFVRYFLLKMIKDKLPDQGNQFQSEESSLDDSLSFILQNLEEMNRLWIRLNTGVTGNEKLIKDKERLELKILVGENIHRLSSLNGLTIDMYKNDVLPKVINIILESKDQLSQQYLCECLIQAFPDDYTIECIELILDASSKLVENVDVKAIFVTLMEKLTRYVANSQKEDENIMNSIEKVFGYLQKSIENMIKEGLTQFMDPLKLLQLESSFMKFTIKCCPKKDKVETVNHILASTSNIIKNQNIGNEGNKLIFLMLIEPLDSDISVFELEKYSELMVHLEYIARKNIALKIIDGFVKGKSKEKLDSVVKIELLIDYLKPLLEDSNDLIESDVSQFEYEQNIVAKIIFIISSNNPNTLIEIYLKLQAVFLKGGPKRKKYTLPCLANALIHLAYQVSSTYDSKVLPLPSDNRSSLHQDFINLLDMSFVDSNETYMLFMKRIYEVLLELINGIAKDRPEESIRILLSSISQINSVRAEREQYKELCESFFKSMMTIYSETKFEPELKYTLHTEIIGHLLHMTLFSNESLDAIIATLVQAANAMVKRPDQCRAMLNLASCYFSLMGNKAKVVDCINKAKRFADFAMTNPSNLYLFVIIINKLMYFIEKQNEVIITADIVDDTIEVYKNHIQTITSENTQADYLPPIQLYFNQTMASIIKRKAKKDKQVYQDIQL